MTRSLAERELALAALRGTPPKIRAPGSAQGDLLLDHTHGSCGGLGFDDGIGFRFENGDGNFVVSYEDLKHALAIVDAARAERRYYIFSTYTDMASGKSKRPHSAEIREAKK